MPDARFVNLPGNGPIIYSDQGSGTRAAQDLLNFQKNNSEVFSVSSTGLPDPGGAQQTRYVQYTVGDIVAESDAKSWTILEVRATITIISIFYTVDTNTADGTSNGQTFLIEDESNNAITTNTLNAGDPGATQAVWVTCGTVTAATLTADDYLTFSPTKVSSGLDMSGLAFYITYTMGT